MPQSHLICLVSVSVAVAACHLSASFAHTQAVTHTRTQLYTHTRRPHVFLAGALAVLCVRALALRAIDESVNFMSSSLAPATLGAINDDGDDDDDNASKQAAVTTAAAAAAFAVSSSAAAVTFFFLLISFFFFVFHDFFLAAASCCLCPPFHCGYATAVAFPFPITPKRFHVCLTHTHTCILCFSAISIDFFV